MQWPYLSVPALYNSGCHVMLNSCSLCTSVAAYFAPVYLHTEVFVQLQRLQIAALTGYSDRFLLFQSPCCYACTTSFCHIFGFGMHVFKVHFSKKLSVAAAPEPPLRQLSWMTSAPPVLLFRQQFLT
jgi:hypothetical protein